MTTNDREFWDAIRDLHAYAVNRARYARAAGWRERHTLMAHAASELRGLAKMAEEEPRTDAYHPPCAGAAPDYEAYAERFWSTPPEGVEVREEPTFHPLGRDALERHHAVEQDYSDAGALPPASGQDDTC